jgi:hypothetical protein
MIVEFALLGGQIKVTIVASSLLSFSAFSETQKLRNSSNTGS